MKLFVFVFFTSIIICLGVIGFGVGVYGIYLFSCDVQQTDILFASFWWILGGLIAIGGLFPLLND
jgi:hypothetical protein